jgi:hypothetical protein
MATQTCYPGTVANEDYFGVDWQNLNNAKTNDGTFATADIDETAGSNLLVCSNYGFAIPTGAIIDAITVTVKAKSESSSSMTFGDNQLHYSGGFVNYGTFADTVLTTTNTEYQSLTDSGGTDVLWGRTWTPAEINSSELSFKLNIISYTGTPELAYVDFISITVDYTEGGGGGSAIKSVNGLAKADIKSVNGLAIASVKSINGLE